MISLLKKFLSEPKIVKFSVDELKLFFKANGVEINQFPEMENRNEFPLLKYYVWFENVSAVPIRTETGKTKTHVTGLYWTQAAANHKVSDGTWRPGMPSKYKFSYLDGKLEIEDLKLSINEVDQYRKDFGR